MLVKRLADQTGERLLADQPFFASLYNAVKDVSSRAASLQDGDVTNVQRDLKSFLGAWRENATFSI
jgi:hypothetical protein